MADRYRLGRLLACLALLGADREPLVGIKARAGAPGVPGQKRPRGLVGTWVGRRMSRVGPVGAQDGRRGGHGTVLLGCAAALLRGPAATVGRRGKTAIRGKRGGPGPFGKS